MATGFPFGAYDYSGAARPEAARRAADHPAGLDLDGLAGLAGRGPAGRRPGRRGSRSPRVGLAAWDLFLDPQMVAEGYWPGWIRRPALPGVPGVPVGNYLGWLASRWC